jgi:hypothetical protein
MQIEVNVHILKVNINICDVKLDSDMVVVMTMDGWIK